MDRVHIPLLLFCVICPVLILRSAPSHARPLVFVAIRPQFQCSCCACVGSTTMLSHLYCCYFQQGGTERLHLHPHTPCQRKGTRPVKLTHAKCHCSSVRPIISVSPFDRPACCDSAQPQPTSYLRKNGSNVSSYFLCLSAWLHSEHGPRSAVCKPRGCWSWTGFVFITITVLVRFCTADVI